MRNRIEGLYKASLPIIGASLLTAGVVYERHRSPNRENISHSTSEFGQSPFISYNEYITVVETALTEYTKESVSIEVTNGKLASGLLTEEDIQKAHQQSMDFLIKGAYLSRAILPKDRVKGIEVSTDKKTITFHNRVFHLENPLHPHLLRSLITKELYSFNNDLQKSQGNHDFSPFIFERNRQELQSDIEDILWLYDQNLPIKIDKDAYVLLPTENVFYLARTLHILYDSNLPLPVAITYKKWKEGDPGGAWYHGHPQTGPERFTIVITNHSSPDSFAHETGHFISDAISLMPDNIRLANSTQGHYNSIIDTSDSQEETNSAEDYARRFTNYLFNGTEFRDELISLQNQDPTRYEILLRKYLFFKNLFNGREFFSIRD